MLFVEKYLISGEQFWSAVGSLRRDPAFERTVVGRLIQCFWEIETDVDERSKAVSRKLPTALQITVRFEPAARPIRGQR
jgi:hypothetical protein